MDAENKDIIYRVRDKTGMGIIDVKRALENNDYNENDAIEELKAKSRMLAFTDVWVHNSIK